MLMTGNTMVTLQAARAGWKDGCCCVSAIVANNVVYIANLGDCAAVLCRRKKVTPGGTATSTVQPKASAAEDFRKRWGLPPVADAKKLTTDHNLLQATERARVIAAGGTVENGRVNGIMEVSRSFGDISLKRFGVIAKPDVRIHFKLSSADEFLLLACDGLWSVLDATSAVTFVRERIWVRFTVDSQSPLSREVPIISKQFLNVGNGQTRGFLHQLYWRTPPRQHLSRT